MVVVSFVFAIGADASLTVETVVALGAKAVSAGWTSHYKKKINKQCKSIGTMYTLLFDGAYKRTGCAGAGFVIYDASGKEIQCGNRNLTGRGTTNNTAEYNGLLAGLRCLKDLGLKDVKVLGDSSLVIQQVFGTWKIKADHLKPLVSEAKSLVAVGHHTGEWIPRHLNTRADELANMACRKDFIHNQKPEWWST
jgi:ribonuclease HI